MFPLFPLFHPFSFDCLRFSFYFSYLASFLCSTVNFFSPAFTFDLSFAKDAIESKLSMIYHKSRIFYHSVSFSSMPINYLLFYGYQFIRFYLKNASEFLEKPKLFFKKLHFQETKTLGISHF